MVDFERTPQVDLAFMNREHRKAFDDANALTGLLDKLLKRLLDGGLESLGEQKGEAEMKTSLPHSAKIEQLLQVLLLDTVTHFELEEQCMEQYGFPARGEHNKEHQRVLKWMAEQQGLLTSDCNVETISHLRSYAADQFPNWLLNHIVTMDTVMASYVHRHGGTSL
jgi:hemerythrin-like metal-binding protein